MTLTISSTYFFPQKVIGVFPSGFSRPDAVDTTSVTGFVSSRSENRFNYNFKRMVSRVESETVAMPNGLNSVEDLDAWLMGLDLE